MFDDETEDQDVSSADFGKDGADKGDGLHHHELHEDEGGGYHSKHTHPDGKVEHADHATYEDARDHQDRMFGHGEDNAGDGSDDGSGDMRDDGAADSYSASCGR